MKNPEINHILFDIRKNHHVKKMNRYIQHGNVTTLQHSENVVRMCEKMNRTLHLHANHDTLFKGAMLHDFYLYDWHEYDGGTHTLHGFHHPKTASENAKRIFDVNEEIQHVIQTHMWPLTIRKMPRSREAWIVCVADKIVSLKETFIQRS